MRESSPSSSPRTGGLGVCENNEKVVERAAGVAEFLGVIQVSERGQEVE